jgi:trans-aconitate methyltransferase
MTREQRLVFGEVAEQYDRARPGYPPTLVDQILEYGSLAEGDAALEVGCGTGKATIAIAARGLRVQAVEPDPAMADVARRNCQGVDVAVDVASFEDWPAPAAAYRLVYSAQAWHWVAPEVRVVKAHATLVPGGALAVFWNRPDWPDTPLRHAIDAVYDAEAPRLGARTPGRSPQDLGRRAATEQLDASPLFTDRAHGSHEWDATYSTAEYIELLGTQSDHRLLDPDARARLYDGIARAVDDAGGVMPVSYSADVLLARRVG